MEHNLKSTPRPIHYDADSDKCDQRSNYIVLIWRNLVYLPTPQHRHNYEDPTISGINSSKMCWLECWDNAVKYEYDGPDDSEP